MPKVNTAEEALMCTSAVYNPLKQLPKGATQHGISPLPKRTQYEYEAQMARPPPTPGQAGASHREHRTTVMVEYQHPDLEKKLVPGTNFKAKDGQELIKPQRTQLIRDVNGEYKLVPRQCCSLLEERVNSPRPVMPWFTRSTQNALANLMTPSATRLSRTPKKLQSSLTASEEKVKKHEAQQPIIVNTAFISQPVADGTAWGNPTTPTLSGFDGNLICFKQRVSMDCLSHLLKDNGFLLAPTRTPSGFAAFASLEVFFGLGRATLPINPPVSDAGLSNDYEA
ncbi:hypothetical protein KCV07_g6776, partial [Aureobasidium melanogenum]